MKNEDTPSNQGVAQQLFPNKEEILIKRIAKLEKQVRTIMEKLEWK